MVVDVGYGEEGECLLQDSLINYIPLATKVLTNARMVRDPLSIGSGQDSGGVFSGVPLLEAIIKLMA